MTDCHTNMVLSKMHMKEKIIYILLFLIPFIIDNGLNSYICYSIILLLVLLTKKGGFIRIRELNGFILSILLIVFTNIFRFEQYTTLLFKDIGLMLIGISPFLFRSKMSLNQNKFNILILFGLLLTIGAGLGDFHLSVQSFIFSDFGIELGTYAYILGMFALVAYRNKNYRLFFIDFIALFICGKRIAMLAIIVCVISETVFKYKNGDIGLKLRSVIIGGVFVFLFFVWLFTEGVFDELIFNYTGLSANAFTMGRQTLYYSIHEHFGIFNLLGIGAGNTIPLVNSLTEDTRLHNDFLKIFVENGLVIFIFYLSLLVKSIKFENLSIYLFIFMIFLTTNTFIYAYMLCYYCIFIDSEKYITMSSNVNDPKHMLE